MANQCKECGCVCTKCSSSDHDVHLHVEIENLKQRLVERDNHIVKMETNFLNEANKFPNGELVAIREELLTWQDKYKRLYEAHRRVQRVNQGLEDKLLRLVDICETDKSTLTKDVATLSHKLAEANYTIKKLTEDNERYKNDVALAIQFLQCKPGNFVSQKFDTLPSEVQAKVSMYMANKRKPEERKTPPEVKSIKVPIPTFPPTAMVYSIPKSPSATKKIDKDVENNAVDIVSAAIMAKVLEERERERSCIKHCDTCTCTKTIKIINDNTSHSVSTQTGEYKNALCLKCNATLEQLPNPMKLVKNLENKPKTVPIYIHEHAELIPSNLNQNIAKVQPNNFLIDIKNDMSEGSKSNKAVDGDSNNENARDSLELDVQDVAFYKENEKTKPVRTNVHKVTPNIQDICKVAQKPNKEIEEASIHHYLCDKSSPTFELNMKPGDANISTEQTTANASPQVSDALKGPRYCSMRLQSGSKNILLDNAHNNIAPVMYTRHNEKKKRDVKVQENFRPSSCSSDEKSNSVLSDNSFQNQRVAEWIRNNMDIVPSSSENLRSESLNSDDISNAIDPDEYAEMEYNVKIFLFGESEFLKKVEIGKLKYQNYQDTENVSSKGDKNPSNSHTETEI